MRAPPSPVVAARSLRLLAGALQPKRSLAMTHAQVDRVRSLVPPLDEARHKGQAGRVGVVGGCREYTGAPFFAAMSALRVGADLSHVFCVTAAAPVIKSYSAELIVHPSLRESQELTGTASDAALAKACDDVASWLPRLDALVVGPGLGRDESVLKVAEAVVKRALERRLPLVLDGDGLFLVTRSPEILLGDASAKRRVVMTPNVNEFRRLQDALGMVEPAPRDLDAAAASLASMSRALGGACIVQKGLVDLIACADAPVMRCAEHGSPRRCGGQGDVLAGTTGVFAAWAVAATQREGGGEADLQLAAYAACLVTRQAAALAFAARKRSMVAGDLLQELGAVIERLAPCGTPD